MGRFGILDIFTLEDYRQDVERYIREMGPYSHNLVSLTLRQVEKQYGIEAANQMVTDFNLTKKFGIRRKVVND